MSGSFTAKVSDFAHRIGALLSSCVDVDVDMHAELVSGAVRLGPEVEGALDDKGGFKMVPLIRTVDQGEPRMHLKVNYRIDQDPDGGYLRVLRSAFGLWVSVSDSRSSRPMFRVEYDRDKTTKPPAHVQLHAESAELAWIYGTAGMDMPRLSEIHFPVGGRRFGPSIEDVLLFLDAERIFTDWRPGWRSALDDSRDEWERIQAAATARRYPATTARALENIGYTVLRPVD